MFELSLLTSIFVIHALGPVDIHDRQAIVVAKVIEAHREWEDTDGNHSKIKPGPGMMIWCEDSKDWTIIVVGVTLKGEMVRRRVPVSVSSFTDIQVGDKIPVYELSGLFVEDMWDCVEIARF